MRRGMVSSMAHSGRAPARKAPTKRLFRRYQYPDARTSNAPQFDTQSESDLMNDSYLLSSD